MTFFPPRARPDGDWHRHRSFASAAFGVDDLLRRELSVSVCLPARNEAATIGAILAVLIDLRKRGALDQVVVIDHGSEDGTGDVARAAGAEVHRADDLLGSFGPVLGKGDVMWRGLAATTGDVVCYLDADSEEFGPHFASSLLGPILADDGIDFVKGRYRRPLKVGDVTLPVGGGRVTELTARPLLNCFYPELAVFDQPLAGEIAGRRSLLERVPFATGYAAEIAMLIDTYELVGLDRLAQADLRVRQNRHRPLSELSPMAAAVLQAVVARLQRSGRLTGEVSSTLLTRNGVGPESLSVEVVERPPLRQALAIYE